MVAFLVWVHLERSASSLIRCKSLNFPAVIIHVGRNSASFQQLNPWEKHQLNRLLRWQNTITISLIKVCFASSGTLQNQKLSIDRCIMNELV
ncbi:hypothetical protein GMES_2472 [Paraglaciecola mesophila KMM 241]|uniref:Uncharacterized protein n=1 Tax=Paraglaciecola mesophila KMM 241 TaxID=1128912 RepID=K6Z2Z5_9ALTE|nr:hypothetical protein GMES_2472 [Paraglaciecola mesophila KMM 241]